MSILWGGAGLPVHPTKRHPLTGKPLQALGLTSNGRVIWPVMGGSQPTGEPQPNPTPGPPPGPPQPGPNPNPHPAAIPMPPVPTPAGLPATPPAMGNGEHGYPENTPVNHMTADQQAAYWRHYARRNEDRLKQMGDYAQLKEQAEAYQKYLQESATEQQRAVAEAEQRGRKAAAAEYGGQMVEAYVRAAATGRMTEEQVNTLLQGLDRTRFVNPATGQVDAQMVQGYVSMLAPAPLPTPGYVPAPGVMPAGVVYPPGGPQAPGVAVQPQLTYPPAGTQTVGAPAQAQVAWNGYPPQPGQPPAQPDMGASRQVPSYGQAQYPTPQPRGLEAGKAIAQQRFGSKKPA